MNMNKKDKIHTLAEKIYLSVLDHDNGVVYPMSIGAKVSETQKEEVINLFEEVNNTYKGKNEMPMELVSVLIESVEALTGLEAKGADIITFVLSVKESLQDLAVSKEFYDTLIKKMD
ncbi:MAG: hypothetical protein PHR25_00860 [Clostridia bacterium]|nr:hypothetical protein [Clostridia bacterium]